ncbi:hypothetical protein BGZ63DRAFT_401909 [Mariannaea sp. PMI_226]|nr:hypothetical protein BGZ63DRAFT_401909 [Mariannaea sp. PMI_226]
MNTKLTKARNEAIVGRMITMQATSTPLRTKFGCAVEERVYEGESKGPSPPSVVRYLSALVSLGMFSGQLNTTTPDDAHSQTKMLNWFKADDTDDADDADDTSDVLVRERSGCIYGRLFVASILSANLGLDLEWILTISIFLTKEIGIVLPTYDTPRRWGADHDNGHMEAHAQGNTLNERNTLSHLSPHLTLSSACLSCQKLKTALSSSQ